MRSAGHFLAPLFVLVSTRVECGGRSSRAISMARPDCALARSPAGAEGTRSSVQPVEPMPAAALEGTRRKSA